MPMDRQSDLEKSLQGKELQDSQKRQIETQFNEALTDVTKKMPEWKVRDAVSNIVNDITDSETADGTAWISQERQKDIQTLQDALSDAKLTKEAEQAIQILYGYLTEIDELDTAYQKEIQAVIDVTRQTAADIMSVFTNMQSADFAKTKISLEKNNTASATTTDTTVNTSSNKDTKETPKNDTTIDKGLDAKPAAVDAPKGENKTDTTIDKDLNPKDTSKEVSKDTPKTDSTIDSGITVDTGLGDENEKKEKADEASANEEVKEESSKRNYAEYKEFEAEWVDQMPENARKAFRKAIESGQLRMGDEVTDDAVIYEGGKLGTENTTFRDMFRMFKNVNVANAFTILKQGLDNKGGDLVEFASIDKGQFVLKSPDAVENFWKKQLKNEKTPYRAKDGFSGTEKHRLVQFTETFFKIANKANKQNANEKLFMAGVGLALAADSTDKKVLSQSLLGTQEISRSLGEKLKNSDMKMDTAIAGVLWNYNFDKKVDSKDIHTVTGQEMAAMYNDIKNQMMLASKETDPKCIKEETETKMVQNMVDMLIYHIDTKGNGAGKVDWKTMSLKGRDAAVTELKGFKTEKELLQKIAAVPSLIIAYQDIFRLAWENASVLFLKGQDGYKEVVERKVRWQEPKKAEVIGDWDRPYEQLDADAIVAPQEVENLSPELKKNVESHVSEAYERAVQDLYNKVKEGKYADGTEIPENLRPQIEEAAAALLDTKVGGANKKLLTVNALGALINTIKWEQGIWVGANVTSEKLNDLLSNPEKGWYNSINLTPGVYASPDGKPIIGMMLGLQGKKTSYNKWGDHTFMYGAAVGAGMANGRLVAGPWVNLGYEEQINGRGVVKSISKEKANYIGGVLAASLTEVGVGLYFRQDQYRAIEQQQQAIEGGLKGILQNAVQKADSLNEAAIWAALMKQFPKSNSADISKMAQNITAMIKPYLFEAKDKKELQAHLNALGWTGTVDQYIAQVMEDCAKLYALDWRNNQVQNNMKRFQITDFGIGKSLSLNAADPVGTFVKNILPIYAGVGATLYSKARYQDLAWSKKNANEQLRMAYGVDADDKVSEKWSDKVPNLNLIFQGIAGNTESSDKKDATTIDKTEAPKAVEYFTVAGNNVLIDPAVLSLSGMNVSILHAMKPYVNYENGKLVVPNTIPVMFHSTFEGKKKAYDLIIGTVWLENTASVKSFDKLAGWHPEKIGDLGTVSGVDGLVAGINNAKDNADLKEVHNIATFTTVEKLGAGSKAEYKEYQNKLLVWVQDGTVLDGNVAKTKPIDGKVYYIIDNPNHAQISFDKVKGKQNTYKMTVNSNESLPMSLAYKGFKESDSISTLKENIENIVKNNGVKDFVEGAEINKNLLSKEVHEPVGNSLKDKIVRAIEEATIADTKWMPSEKSWQLAADLANTLPGNDKKVFKVEKDEKWNVTDTVKHSLRYLNAKMAVTPFARDRDSLRYDKRKDKSSDIIKGNDPQTIALLDKLYKQGALSSEENKILLEKLGKENKKWEKELNITEPIGHVMNARETKIDGMDMVSRRLKNENYNPTDITAFKKYRNESANKLGWRNTAQVYAGQEMKGAIGMVFGYEWTGKKGAYDEKFVVQPNLATKPGSVEKNPDSYVLIDNKKMREHFLYNLKTEDGWLLDSILKPLVEKACGEWCYEGVNKAKAIKQFVDGMIDKGSADISINGQSFSVKADFGHAFYNECFNETIVMSNIQVETTPKQITGDTTFDNKGGLYMNTYNTVGELVRDQKKITVGIIAGEQQQKQEEYTSGTDTGNGDGTSTGTGDGGTWDGGSAWDIPGWDTGSGTTPDIPVGTPTPDVQYTNTMNASTVYPQIVNAVNFNSTSQNIKNKAATDITKTEKKQDDEKKVDKNTKKSDDSSKKTEK